MQEPAYQPPRRSHSIARWRSCSSSAALSSGVMGAHPARTTVRISTAPARAMPFMLSTLYRPRSSQVATTRLADPEASSPARSDSPSAPVASADLLLTVDGHPGLAMIGLSARTDTTRMVWTVWKREATRWQVAGLALLAAEFLLLAPTPSSGQLARSPAPASRAGSEAVPQLAPVVVIDTTPVPALGTPIEKYAGNVQTISPRDLIQNENVVDISDLLYRNFGSVNV